MQSIAFNSVSINENANNGESDKIRKCRDFNRIKIIATTFESINFVNNKFQMKIYCFSTTNICYAWE